MQQTDLSSLFAPPEEIIYGSHAPDRAAIQRMRDIAQFTDDKTLYMAKQYRYVCHCHWHDLSTFLAITIHPLSLFEMTKM